jgi:putative hemolysin
MLGKKKAHGIDVDQYDSLCDHLAIIEKKTGKLVGTYRLNCSLFSSQFYSANEFYLRHLLETPGIKIELGRACIHKDYRRGLVISLLWRGIAEYMNITKASWLFGCASFKVENPRQSALLFRYFQEEGRLDHSLLCPPTPSYSMNQLSFWLERIKLPLQADERIEAESLIPSLAKAYLNAGALIAGEPAYDPDFNCIDFLTILPQENLNKALWRKYGVWEKTQEGESEPNFAMRPSSGNSLNP